MPVAFLDSVGRGGRGVGWEEEEEEEEEGG